MKLWIILTVSATCTALVGCSTQEDLLKRAMVTPAPELCYYAAAGNANARQAAYYAIQARAVDCNSYAAIVAARIQQNQAQSQLGLQLLQAARPQPVQAQPAPTNCRTYNRGTYLQTVCD